MPRCAWHLSFHPNHYYCVWPKEVLSGQTGAQSKSDASLFSKEMRPSNRALRRGVLVEVRRSRSSKSSSRNGPRYQVRERAAPLSAFRSLKCFQCWVAETLPFSCLVLSSRRSSLSIVYCIDVSPPAVSSSPSPSPLPMSSPLQTREWRAALRCSAPTR